MTIPPPDSGNKPFISLAGPAKEIVNCRGAAARESYIIKRCSLGCLPVDMSSTLYATPRRSFFMTAVHVRNPESLRSVRDHRLEPLGSRACQNSGNLGNLFDAICSRYRVVFDRRMPFRFDLSGPRNFRGGHTSSASADPRRRSADHRKE